MLETLWGMFRHSGKLNETAIIRHSKNAHAVWAAIQRLIAIIAELAKQYNLNPKTVMKWRSRSSLEDLPTALKKPCLTVQPVEEGALCISFREHTLLPLDERFYTLQESTPYLTRS
jgi:hypothetical protein